MEICDLLSPDDVLVMVKRAKGSDALSHLFSQALVAVQTLRNSPEGRERFAEKVAAARQGHGLPEDFRPSKVVFAILLKDGTDLTAYALLLNDSESRHAATCSRSSSRTDSAGTVVRSTAGRRYTMRLTRSR